MLTISCLWDCVLDPISQKIWIRFLCPFSMSSMPYAREFPRTMHKPNRLSSLKGTSFCSPATRLVSPSFYIYEDTTPNVLVEHAKSKECHARCHLQPRKAGSERPRCIITRSIPHPVLPWFNCVGEGRQSMKSSLRSKREAPKTTGQMDTQASETPRTR